MISQNGEGFSVNIPAQRADKNNGVPALVQQLHARLWIG